MTDKTPSKTTKPKAAKPAKPKAARPLGKTVRANRANPKEPPIKLTPGPGAPSGYTPELVERARNYLVNYRDCGDVVPTIAGLACEIGATRESCYFWEKDPRKPEFAAIMANLRQIQERGLVNSGLDGSFNSTITKLMMASHGYSDRVEQAITSPDGSMSPKDINPALVSALVEKLTN